MSSSEWLTVFETERIVLDLECERKEDILRALLERACGAFEMGEEDVEALYEQVRTRESSGSTGVGRIAIPHVKSDRVPRSVGAIAVFRDGVDFAAIDGELVHCVFLLLSPTAAAQEHVGILRHVASLARKPDFGRFVRQAKSSEEVRSLLEEMAPS